MGQFLQIVPTMSLFVQIVLQFVFLFRGGPFHDSKME